MYRLHWCVLVTLFLLYPSEKSLSSTCPSETYSTSTGFAQIKITPSKKVTLGGYGTYLFFKSATRTNGEGIHDDIYASTIWLQKNKDKAVALVSTDLVGISPAIVDRIKQRLGEYLEEEIDIIISATHNHHSPDTLGLWGALPNQTGRDQEYMELLDDKITLSVLMAKYNASCAQLSWASGYKATTFARDLPADNQEERVFTLLARNSEGEILGTFTQWSAHPTILDGDNNTISSDFPGTFRYFLGESLPGIHIYANGMLGNSYVPLSPDDRIADPFIDGDRDPHSEVGYEQVAYHGNDLAQIVLTAIKSTETTLRIPELTFATETFEIPITNTYFRLANRLGIIEKRDLSKGSIATQIDLLLLGELAIASLPGEVFPSGTAHLRSQITARDQPTMFLGIGNDWLGYIMTSEEYEDEKYQYHKSLSPHQEALTHISAAYQRLSKKVNAK